MHEHICNSNPKRSGFGQELLFQAWHGQRKFVGFYHVWPWGVVFSQALKNLHNMTWQICSMVAILSFWHPKLINSLSKNPSCFDSFCRAQAHHHHANPKEIYFQWVPHSFHKLWRSCWSNNCLLQACVPARQCFEGNNLGAIHEAAKMAATFSIFFSILSVFFLGWNLSRLLAAFLSQQPSVCQPSTSAESFLQPFLAQICQGF